MIPVRDDVAIIGMSCILPGAADVETYWWNIVTKDTISDPPESWGPPYLCDPNSTANDRVYVRRGGHLGDLSRFNPLPHGIMPHSVDGG